MNHSSSILETCKMCPRVWPSGEQREVKVQILIPGLFCDALQFRAVINWDGWILLPVLISLLHCICIIQLSLNIWCKPNYLYLNFITASAVCVSIKKEVSLPCDCTWLWIWIVFAVWLHFHTKWKAGWFLSHIICPTSNSNNDTWPTQTYVLVKLPYKNVFCIRSDGI